MKAQLEEQTQTEILKTELSGYESFSKNNQYCERPSAKNLIYESSS